MPQVIIPLITAVIVAVITWFVAVNYRQKTYEAKIGSAEERSREIIDEALKVAETTVSYTHLTLPTIRLV